MTEESLFFSPEFLDNAPGGVRIERPPADGPDPMQRIGSLIYIDGGGHAGTWKLTGHQENGYWHAVRVISD